MRMRTKLRGTGIWLLSASKRSRSGEKHGYWLRTAPLSCTLWWKSFWQWQWVARQTLSSTDIPYPALSSSDSNISDTDYNSHCKWVFFFLFFFVSLPQVKNRAGRDASVTMPQSDFERSWKWLCSWYYKRCPFRRNFHNNLWAAALRNKWCVAEASPWCQSCTLTTPVGVLWGFVTFSGFWLTDPLENC